MAGLIALIASVAALDSLNPSTIGPALLLAVGRRPGREVAAFVTGVFAVSTAGGLVLLFGPGRALLARIAKPTPHTQHLAEAISGAVILLAAVVLWLLRHRLRQRLQSPKQRSGRASILLGAGIMAVELPTAFPYFAGLVAVVESRRSVVSEVLLVLLYNVLFIAPLLIVLALAIVGGEAGEQLARVARRKLDKHAPTLAPVALALIGAALLAFGGSRL